MGATRRRTPDKTGAAPARPEMHQKGDRGAAEANEALRARVTELETDLAAARTSLRRMIRHENRPVIAGHAPAGDT
jgi:hypothetical protein